MFQQIVLYLCIYLIIWQVLAVPFALTNEAVTSIVETAQVEGGGWKGHLQGVSWGLYIDFALLLIFGGIPWQVSNQPHTLAISKTLPWNILNVFQNSCNCLLQNALFIHTANIEIIHPQEELLAYRADISHWPLCFSGRNQEKFAVWFWYFTRISLVIVNWKGIRAADIFIAWYYHALAYIVYK